MAQDLPDLVVGGIFFTGLIVLAVLGGGLLQRASTSRYRRALAALAPVINGAVESDHKAAWMRGEFEGRPVRVKMTPNLDIGYSSETSIRINSFEIILTGQQGGASWEIQKAGILRKSWKISTDDDKLNRQLEATDLVSRLKDIGKQPSLHFDPHSGTLRYHEDVQPRLAPTAAHFRAQLELLAHAAEINARHNARNG